MGRGKKKGDKKKGDEGTTEDVPSLSSLSISEGQASTSGSGPSQAASSASETSTAKPPEEAPEPAQPEEEDDGLGLGLGGGKKKRPRKKKSAADSAAAPSGPPPQQQPGSAAPAATERPGIPASLSFPPMQGGPALPPVQSAPGFPPVQSAPGYPPMQGAPRFPPVQSAPGFPPAQSAPGFPPAKGAPGFPPAQGAPGFPPAQGAPGFPPAQGAPGFPPAQGAPGFPPAQGAPGLQSGPGFPPSQGDMQRGPKGKSRGAPPGQRGPQPGYQTTGGPQAPPVQPQALSAATAQPAQALAPVKKPPRGDIYSGPRDTPLCIFKIPAKILGNQVPCRKVQVLTNYLPMTIKPLKIHRYDVSFSPDKPKKMLAKAYQISKQTHFPQSLLAFDQMKNCYALQALPGVGDSRYVTNVEFADNNGRVMKFEVSYKFTGIVDLGTILKYMTPEATSLSPPTEAIQCVDVILRQGTLESYIKAGRQFFRRPASPIDLGDGLEMWTGLFQSAIFTSRPFINIDVAHKGFPRQQTLIEALEKDFRLSTDRPIDEQRGRGVDPFKAFIKGVRVMANIGGDGGIRREFIVNDIADPPNKLFFTLTDPNTKRVTKMSVLDYFAKEKKIRLRYPNLSCLWVGPRDKNIYYPMEMLSISYGQVINKQLNENQLSTMVREAATPPSERKRKIEEVIRDMNYSNNPYFKKFGLEIKNEFFPVEARVLTPPKLDVGGQRTVDPAKGAWFADRLQNARDLGKWGFIGLECDANACNAEQFIQMFKDVGAKMGMQTTAPFLMKFNVRLSELTSLLFQALEKEIRVLIIVVAKHGKDYYHRVKQMAERDVGILTQCIKENTASRRWNLQTAKNVILKVNSKLMGVNQALSKASMPKCIAAGGVMIVGADVTHPSPDQLSVPSIAAVTASMDSFCYRYNIQLSIQTPKKEVIVEFEDMMVEHLTVYHKVQKALPKKIFVFRDGVSEGQFAEVMNSELVAVHRAYERLAGPGGAKPEVLFLLVQKRHHTRLFSGPNNPQNVEPGTVVDTHIVHARELDFYLVSHQAIKGTARPTRYHAVCNDGKIPHDEVEQLTFYLCHLYSRCMRSVSYPTPTYYAHLACLRARSLTYGQKFDNAQLEKQPQRLRVLDKMLMTSRMFFV